MSENVNIYICKDIRNVIIDYVNGINHYELFKYCLEEFKDIVIVALSEELTSYSEEYTVSELLISYTIDE